MQGWARAGDSPTHEGTPITIVSRWMRAIKWAGDRINFYGDTQPLITIGFRSVLFENECSFVQRARLEVARKKRWLWRPVPCRPGSGDVRMPKRAVPRNTSRMYVTWCDVMCRVVVRHSIAYPQLDDMWVLTDSTNECFVCDARTIREYCCRLLYTSLLTLPLTPAACNYF